MTGVQFAALVGVLNEDESFVADMRDVLGTLVDSEASPDMNVANGQMLSSLLTASIAAQATGKSRIHLYNALDKIDALLKRPSFKRVMASVLEGEMDAERVALGMAQEFRQTLSDAERELAPSKPELRIV